MRIQKDFDPIVCFGCMTNGKTVAIYFGHPKLHQLTSARCKNLPTFGSHLLLARLREILFRFMNECVIEFGMCM